jgi:hypothetical protein
MTTRGCFTSVCHIVFVILIWSFRFRMSQTHALLPLYFYHCNISHDYWWNKLRRRRRFMRWCRFLVLHGFDFRIPFWNVFPEGLASRFRSVCGGNGVISRMFPIFDFSCACALAWMCSDCNSWSSVFIALLVIWCRLRWGFGEPMLLD